jgi:hypothetical protein
MSDVRVPLTVRLKPEDRDLFVQVAEECGLEGGTAARQLVELMIKRLRKEPNYLAALLTVQSALLDEQDRTVSASSTVR